MNKFVVNNLQRRVSHVEDKKHRTTIGVVSVLSVFDGIKMDYLSNVKRIYSKIAQAVALDIIAIMTLCPPC